MHTTDTTTTIAAQAGTRKGRPNYPAEFKLQLAQRACEPGVSASRLAREHGINVNMLLKWRRHYRAGLLGAVPAVQPALLPVTIGGVPAFIAPCAASAGRIEIDNSAAERALRGVALGRRNYLFAGADSGGVRAAAMSTLIGTARLNGVKPQSYLRHVLARIAEHPINRIDELLPWNVASQLPAIAPTA